MNVLSQRTIGLIVTLLMLISNLYSQDKLYVANGNDIGYIDLADFSYKLITPVPPPTFMDIAITPQGKIYGVSGETIYEVDPVTGVCTNIPLNVTSPRLNGGNSLVSDRNGDLFVIGEYALFKIDMKTATLSYVGSTTLAANGDLCFSDGKLYIVAQANILLEITLDASRNSIVSERVVGTLGVQGDVFSIACNENGICYVVSAYYELALVDLEDATTYIICKPVKGAISGAYGIAMKQEGANDKDIEICGNGLDDDHNGRIDDNDMACRLERGVCITEGQEIFREDFGTGLGNGNALPGLGGSSYHFSTAAPLAEGHYTIVDNPRTAQGNTTWKSIADHSGLPGGRMMVVNGAYTPGEFYRKEVSGLCGGLQYAISASACSVVSAAMLCGTDVSAIPSRIRFRIEDANGKVLGQLAEGYIPADPDPAAKWKEYGMIFTLPENVTTIQIVLLDDAPGGCGNDLAIDDIVFSTCTPLQSVSINGSNNNPFTGCLSTDLTLKVDTTGLKLLQPVFRWQKQGAGIGQWIDIPNTNSAVYTIKGLQMADAGEYRVLINENSIKSCRKTAVSVVAEIKVKTSPVLNVTSTLTVCAGQPLQLQATSAGILQEAVWTSPDGTRYWEMNPLITSAAAVINAGQYTLTIKSEDGCSGTRNTQVTINERAEVDFTFSASVACFRQPVQIIASSTNKITKWLWSTSGDYDISGQNTAAPAITWNVPGTYELGLQTTGECLLEEPVKHHITIQGPPIPGYLNFPEQVCVGMPLPLTVSDYGGTLSWEITGNPLMNGTPDKPIVIWDNTGAYTISYTVSGSCGSVALPAPLPIIVKDPPAVSLMDDTAICRGVGIILQPVYSSDAVAFSWQDGPFVPESRYGIKKSGRYNVVVQDKWGCRSQDEITVQETNCGCDIFIPTAFSPNSDSMNDFFRPVIHCVTAKYEFRIYNRWGQLIFVTQTPGEGWNGLHANGTRAAIGSYVWVVEYEGYEYPDVVRQTGAVTLLR